MTAAIINFPFISQSCNRPLYMPTRTIRAPFICMQSLRACRLLQNATPGIQLRRQFSSRSPLRSGDSTATHRAQQDEEVSTIEERILNLNDGAQKEKSSGAMSRRLEAATEEAIQEGGRAGRKAVEEAGFSEELKNRLLEKIEQQKFRSENAAAFAEAGLSSAAGAGTRDIATAQAWGGAESTEDSVLRMLNDAHKPLNPVLRAGPNLPVVDLRLKKAPKHTRGQMLANAKDKTSIYASSKDGNLSEKEREEMRRDLKERFGPGVRAMPNSIRGLQALANERIEDAIARGQFKNIPRGKGVVRDTRADNPFIDTTEYIMNKMIQRQDIVPPWIEKQQELVKTARIFRARLRNDWKRHAARTISARGGSLQDQMRAADRYAQAEALYNPKLHATDQISVPTNKTDDPVMITVTQPPPSTASPEIPAVQVTIENKDIEVTITNPPVMHKGSLPEQQPTPIPPSPEPLPYPLRDLTWEQAENSYLTLAIKNLNSLTRTYNLMCPDLAKKPYYNLDRELKMMYADVAPELAETIRERANRPVKPLIEVIPHGAGSVFEKFAMEDKAKIYDSRKPLYGFKDFWRDLFRK